MESQPQNPEFRNNPENFHPSSFAIISLRKRELVALLLLYSPFYETIFSLPVLFFYLKLGQIKK